MVEILAGFLSIFKWFFVMLDTITFGLIDNVYNLITIFASGEMFDSTAIEELMRNTYVIIGIFAFFKLAMAFVNAMINPDKLFDSEKGAGSVAKNFIIMFVLLIAVPLAFDLLMEAQKIIVNGNYINKIFLNNDTKAKNPGKMMEKTAVESLIYINDDVYKWEEVKDENGNLKMVKTDELKSECKSNCQEAIDEYNGKIKNSDGVSWGTIMSNVGVSIEADLGNGNEEIYVYNYTILVTTIVGGFITYVLAGFAFDIAVRTVELAVLEVIAPLFIVTYIDPKSAKSGPFHNWLTTVGKTYASLFIKLAILALMFALLGLLDNFGFDGIPGGAMAKLFMLLAILAFAKKAPGWISSLIGIKESEAGLGGLGKKLAALPLVGAGLTKAGHALAGGAVGAVGAINNQLRHRRSTRKELRNNNGLNSGIGKQARNARKSFYEENGLKDAKYADKLKALRSARSKAYAEQNVGWNRSTKDADGNKIAGGMLSGLKQFGAAAGIGIMQGSQAGIKADGMKGVFKGSINAANQFASNVGLKGESFKNKASRIVMGLPGSMADAWGTSTKRFDARDKMKKDKEVSVWTNGKCTSGDGKGQLINSQGGFNKFVSNNKLGSGTSETQISTKDDFLAAQYATNKGYKLEDVSRTKNSEGALAYNFKDEAGRTITVDASNLQKNLNGIVDPSSSAMTTYDKMWNSYQQSCLNNYTQNQQTYAQEAATYQNAVMQGNNSLNQANNSINEAKSIVTALEPALLTALGTAALKIDTSSLENFEKSVNGNLEKISKEMEGASEDKKRELIGHQGSLEEIKNKLEKANQYNEQYIEFSTQANESKGNLEIIRKAQSKLQVVYENIDGVTAAEKSQKLAIQEKKISDTLENFKNKEEK